jgi:hypothetical protein
MAKRKSTKGQTTIYKTNHAVGTIPKSNIKIADRGKTDTPNTYIYFIVHFIAVD